MKNTDVSTLLKPIGKFLQKFHTTLFIVIMVAGLAFAVISLNDLLTEASDPNGAGQLTNQPSGDSGTGFDEATIQKVNALHESTSPGNVTLPSERINPFAE